MKKGMKEGKKEGKKEGSTNVSLQYQVIPYKLEKASNCLLYQTGKTKRL